MPVEEQRTARWAERQVSKFVQDDEIGVTEPRCDLPSLALMLLRFEGIDKINGGEERTRLR